MPTFARTGSARVSLMLCDFSSQTSIRDLASEFRRRHDSLHILINNAGGVSKKRLLTVDGIEQTFAVNHLGYFLLTNLLLDMLERSAPARIVNVASDGHHKGTLDFDDLGFDRGGYSTLAAYGRSKLANILFTRELAKKLQNKNVSVLALHPGAVATNIWKELPALVRPIFNVVAKVFFLRPHKRPSAWCFWQPSRGWRRRTAATSRTIKKLSPRHSRSTPRTRASSGTRARDSRVGVTLAHRPPETRARLEQAAGDELQHRATRLRDEEVTTREHPHLEASGRVKTPAFQLRPVRVRVLVPPNTVIGHASGGCSVCT